MIKIRKKNYRVMKVELPKNLIKFGIKLLKNLINHKIYNFKKFQIRFFKLQNLFLNQYILNTKNEDKYIQFFRDSIIKENPDKFKSPEFDQIFQQFEKELIENQQFIVLDNNRQTQAYLDIFHQNIFEKIEKSKEQILDLKKFFSQEIKYHVIAKSDIQIYLDYNFEKDLKQFWIRNKDEKSIKTDFHNFLSIINYFNITYDQQRKTKLEDLVNKPQLLDILLKIFQDKESQIYKAFLELKESLKFKSLKEEIDLSNKNLGIEFQQTYKNLRVQVKSDQSWNNNIQFKKKLLQDYIIIATQREIQLSSASYQPSFEYIKQSKNTTPNFFRQQFPIQFNKIMLNQNGWKTLYRELYSLIKQEIIGNKSKQPYKVTGIQQNHCFDLDINRQVEYSQQFNQYLITGIMQKVQNKIKVQYNNQFALFGVILTDVGERCIHYYSMLIIWRLICYQRWNQRNLNSQHQYNSKNELDRCIAEINEDNLKQGCIKAKEFINKISTLFKSNFVERTKNEVFEKIKNKSMSNVELIGKLDKQILIDNNDFESEQFQQAIISYTTDHKSYINKYTQDLITQLKTELQTQYCKQQFNELIKYLLDIQNNAKILFKYVEGQTKEIKTNKYFIDEENQKDKIFYENYLFSLVMQCLHGQIKNSIDIIESQYQEIFQDSNYNPVKSEFTVNWQLFNTQNQQIFNLKTFIETVIKQIDLIKNNKWETQSNLNEYQIEVELEKLKLQMNGCEFTCPCCKRKCDQNNDNQHKHQCQNGHQIRGINGIMITQSSPSLYTCEELNDQCKLITLETNIVKTWKEVKQAHSQWDFKYLDNTKNKNKWQNIWNKGLGKLICSYLEKQQQHKIQFQQKSESESMVMNTHYILILDDSGSMSGKNWENAKNGALKCIKSMINSNLAKVSVIIFNGEARIVVECENPEINEISKKIMHNGGNTSFDPPFEKALDLIQKYKNFDKIQILFYTDGLAGYPEKTVNQYCKLPVEIRQIINLTACSGEKISNTLALIIEKFQEHMNSAELKNNVSPADLQIVWTEVVSKNFLDQLV